MATTYLDLVDAVKNYYGSGSDQWLEIAKYGISSDNASSILKQLPNVETTVSSSGKVINYSIIKDVETGVAESLPTIIDSNIQTKMSMLKTSIPLLPDELSDCELLNWYKNFSYKTKKSTTYL